MNDLALFAGAGGGILGSLAAGIRTVCAVEIDRYCRDVLTARQGDGCLPRFPIWDDVRTFDGRPWRGVDIVSGGFPCQDISSAGRRDGIRGARSGLWSEFARVVSEAQPSFVFVENSPHLRTRGLDVVLRDLAGLGYDAEWMVLGASDVGAPHKRGRMWILGFNPDSIRDSVRVQPWWRGWPGWQKALQRGLPVQDASDTDDSPQRVLPFDAKMGSAPDAAGFPGWPRAPGRPRVVDGVAHRMDRVRATGNGQVPRVAALAFLELMSRAISTNHWEKIKR